MPVTLAPASWRARTNCFWLAGKVGSMKTACMDVPQVDGRLWAKGAFRGWER